MYYSSISCHGICDTYVLVDVEENKEDNVAVTAATHGVCCDHLECNGSKSTGSGYG